MKLRFYRFMESSFSFLAAYFGDRADSIDTDLHKKLRAALKDITCRELRASQQGVEVDAEEVATESVTQTEINFCPNCGIKYASQQSNAADDKKPPAKIERQPVDYAPCTARYGHWYF